jgi:hypothetical protein
MRITTAMLVRGEVLRLKIEAVDGFLAGMTTTFRLSILPVHKIPAASKVKIRFPINKNRVTLSTDPCVVTSSDPKISVGMSSCEVNPSTNELSVLNLFANNFWPKNGAEFSFAVSAKGKIPEKACGSIEFVVSTYAIIEGADYPIDHGIFDSAYDLPPILDTFLPKPQTLAATLLNYSS